MSSSSADATSSLATVTYSWCDAGSGTSLPGLNILSGEDAMAEAEHAMSAAMEARTCEASGGAPLPSTPGGVAAPSVHVVPSRCPVMALCVASNARLLEIHQGDGQTQAPPLLTCEANGEAANGWRTHYLMSDAAASSETPLLPPSESGYTIKFFARRPPGVVKLACLCFVCGPAVEDEPAVPADGRSSSSPQLPADTARETHVMYDTLAQHLGRVETQMTVMMQLIMRRLDSLENRIDALEGADGNAAKQI